MKDTARRGVKIHKVFSTLGWVFLWALIVINAVLLVKGVDLLRFPQTISNLEAARQGAFTLVRYYEKYATNLGLEKNPYIRDALAKFKFEVDQGISTEEIGRALSYHGRNVLDVLDRELENRRREAIIQIINQDPIVQQVSGKATVTIIKRDDGILEIIDQGNILSTKTKDELKQSKLIQGLSAELIEVEIVMGKAVLLSPRTIVDRMKLLRGEADNTRANLQDIQRNAGYAELTGTGIIIKVYDAKDGISKDQIVQEKDIRDIVNELYVAGATGLEVGGERLIAVTPIKAIDDTITVNYVPINRNPVTIKATGAPTILISSLDLIRNTLEPWGIVFEIEIVESLTLSAFRGRR